MSLLDPSSRIPLESLPVFPLANTVMFPEQQLPLHIFEPRYRQMVREALDGFPYIVVTWLLPEPGKEPPPFAQLGTVGRIVSNTRLADGRYNIMVEGTVRVTLEEIPSSSLYRRVNCTALTEPYGDEDRVRSVDLAAMLSLVGQVMQLARSRSPDLEFNVPSDLPSARMAFRVTDRLIPDPIWRQRILRTDNATARVRLTTEALAHVLADLGSSAKKPARLQA